MLFTIRNEWKCWKQYKSLVAFLLINNKKNIAKTLLLNYCSHFHHYYGKPREKINHCSSKHFLFSIFYLTFKWTANFCIVIYLSSPAKYCIPTRSVCKWRVFTAFYLSSQACHSADLKVSIMEEFSLRKIKYKRLRFIKRL